MLGTGEQKRTERLSTRQISSRFDSTSKTRRQVLISRVTGQVVLVEFHLSGYRVCRDILASRPSEPVCIFRLLCAEMSAFSYAASITCPMCAATFDRRKTKGFKCPQCGEELTWETETKFNYVWFILSVYGFPIVLYFMGVRNLFALIGGAALLCFAGMTIKMYFSPHQVVQKYGGLRVNDKTTPNKSAGPNDD
jgi:predicted RNA-binding Zn-ribbon protein involved in translation (DUF1610 family)